MSGVSQFSVYQACRRQTDPKISDLILQLWSDYRRLNARCERLENELVEARNRLNDIGADALLFAADHFQQ